MIDSRNRDKRGRVLVNRTDNRVDAPKRSVKEQVTDLQQARRRSANPLTWTSYSKDVDYSVSGLGATRQYKQHPGKVFYMAAATWRESPAEAERAAKQALKNLHVSESGAAKSL